MCQDVHFNLLSLAYLKSPRAASQGPLACDSYLTATKVHGHRRRKRSGGTGEGESSDGAGEHGFLDVPSSKTCNFFEETCVRVFVH
jgi:hypothetical protein